MQINLLKIIFAQYYKILALIKPITSKFLIMLGHKHNSSPLSLESSARIRTAMRRLEAGKLTEGEMKEKKRLQVAMTRFESVWK